MGFEVDTGGNLVNNAANVELLRELWLDRSVIHGDLLGPGDPGDFDHGAWHVACHLVAAGGVRRAADGRLLWLEISYDAARDLYYPSITFNGDTEARTVRVDSVEGAKSVAGSTLLGFVEGTSTGRISARCIIDATDRFNGNPRQNYDQPTDSTADGGKVWEHWCTLRDIRLSAAIGSSVLAAYVALVSVLGDAFTAIVARGRRDYHHPQQLSAMVAAGLISRKAALIELTPSVIPQAVVEDLSLADPRMLLQRCATLSWHSPPRYYMFGRKIEAWVTSKDVAALIA